MIERLTNILNKNLTVETRSSIWEECFSHSTQVELNEENLENMTNTMLVRGFFPGDHEDTYEHIRTILVRLAEGLGVCGIINAEAPYLPVLTGTVDTLTEDEILDRIEEVLAFPILLPGFVGGKTRLQTTRGIICDRLLHYLWILKRVREILPDKNSSILEIGAGMGILGFYLDKQGYKDYTTIDLSTQNLCQTYFLHKNLPEREFVLSGEVENPLEEEHSQSLKLLHASDFKDIPEKRFDILVNVDSLTEIPEDEAVNYIKNCGAKYFLSINHEVNLHRVIDTARPYYKLISRNLFWTRPGYVEELFQIHE